MWLAVKALFSRFLGDKLSLPFGFFLVLFGLILVIVIPNFSQISEKLGFKTVPSLERQNTEQANQDLKHTVDTVHASGQIDLQTVQKTNKDKAEVEFMMNEIKVVAKRQFKQSNDKPVAQVISEIQAHQDELAAIQIDTIWVAYCKTSTDVACTVTQ